MTQYTIVKTKLGYIGIAATAKGLVRATLPQSDYQGAVEAMGPSSFIKGCIYDPEGLQEYQEAFEGYASGQVELDHLPLDFGEATPFTTAVSLLVRSIPRGEVESYGSIAAQVGKPRGARAVGRVMAQNQLCLVIPCHRVVAHDGGLGGFGGGLEQKAQILRLEGVEVVEQGDPTSRRFSVSKRMF